MTITERIMARCVRDGDCLVFQGSKSVGGYAQIRINGRAVGVHRAAYEQVHGPIPEGLEIDHVKARGCHSTACCNVAHMEAVTPRVNVLRGDTIVARNAAKTHCPQGHPLVEGNLLTKPSGAGRRRCRTCDNQQQVIKSRLRRARMRETD